LGKAAAEQPFWGGFQQASPIICFLLHLFPEIRAIVEPHDGSTMLKNGGNVRQNTSLHECVSGCSPGIAPEYASCCTFPAILKNYSARLGHTRVSFGSKIVELPFKLVNPERHFCRMFPLKNCVDPLLSMHFHGSVTTIGWESHTSAVAQEQPPCCGFPPILGHPWADIGCVSITFGPHMHRIVQKTTARNPPWRCWFLRFLSFLAPTLSAFFPFQQQSCSDDPARCMRSIPFRQAFLLRLFAPKPYFWDLQQRILVALGSPKGSLLDQFPWIEKNPRSRRSTPLQHVYAQ